MTYQVRGPDPDGDWFVVLVDGDDETAIDEVFSSEGDARAMVERLEAMPREPGYYWLKEKESRSRPFIASWDGGYWYFIGSLHMTRNDERDEDGDPIMARYEIGARIEPPNP